MKLAALLLLTLAAPVAIAQKYQESDPIPPGATGKVLALSGKVLEIRGLSSGVSRKTEQLAAALQNLGATRVSGVQTSAEYRVGRAWKFSGAYIYEHARVTENSANLALVGKLLPQVPKHRGTLQVVFADPRFATVSLEMLAMGRQFDDDLNTRVVPGFAAPGLPKYAVVSLSVSRAIGSRVNAFAGVQNLFDSEYFVGTLPTTVGSPRLVTAGVRVRFGR